MDYPRVRNLRTCPVCTAGKDVGLLICWPCSRRLQAQNGRGNYGRSTELLLSRIEAHEYAHELAAKRYGLNPHQIITLDPEEYTTTTKNEEQSVIAAYQRVLK